MALRSFGKLYFMRMFWISRAIQYYKNRKVQAGFKALLSLKTESEKKELAKNVAAIANSKGGRGYIIFGIEDGTKTYWELREAVYRRADTADN